MNSISKAQLGLLHHALGLHPERRTPFRNHFLAGPGHHAQADLEVLEAAGLMKRRHAPTFCDKDDVLFQCTEKGEAYAVEHLEEPPKRSKYEQFMRDDFGLSFSEWLGIERPRRERNSHWGETEGWHRMSSSRATGYWKPTAGEAKASYKDALKARRTEASPRKSVVDIPALS